MPDPVPAIAQVEDLLKDLLEGYTALAAHTVQTEQSIDVALDEAALPIINIQTSAYSFDVPPEHWTVQHTAVIEFECVSETPSVGTISRQNMTTIAHIAGAIASDRTLGGMVEDIQEIDVAPVAPNGKDAGTASLQVSVIFYTSPDDWFTLIPQ
jgi:hypothetical protein